MACSKDNLQRAIEEFRSDCESSLRDIALKHGVAKSIPHDHISGKAGSIGKGGPLVLSRDMEREIAATCIALSEMGFRLSKELIEFSVNA